MKKFNLQEFQKDPSRKVVTRDGRPVRIICTDAKQDYSIVALLAHCEDVESVMCYTKDGRRNDDGESQLDLFFDTVKKDGWVNLFMHEGRPETGVIYDTKENADKNSGYGKNPRFIATIHIEWEE